MYKNIYIKSVRHVRKFLCSPDETYEHNPYTRILISKKLKKTGRDVQDVQGLLL